jgi:hypothetical protein
VLSFVGLNVPVANGPASDTNVAPESLSVIVKGPVAAPMPPTSEKTIRVAPLGPTRSISRSSDRALRVKSVRVTVMLVTCEGSPETAIELGYGTPVAVSLIAIDPLVKVALAVQAVGVGVAVAVAVAVGPTVGIAVAVGLAVAVAVAVDVAVAVAVGVGVGPLVVIFKLQPVMAPVSPSFTGTSSTI